MEICRKIDKSLAERHSIIGLLDSLKGDDVTLEEMETIGIKLQKAGKRALSPLIRRLWREENSDQINRYVFLLDFFEEDIWLDHIIRIALKRKDLDESGRSALFAVLEDYGVDLTAPPFSKVLAEINGPLEMVLPKLLDRGEDGLIRFMEDFLGYPDDTQSILIGYLAKLNDNRVISLLEILLRVEERHVAGDAITALGRIRDGRAASLLREMDCRGDVELEKLVDRSLRRLSFLGVVPEPASQPSKAGAECSAAVSSIDGSGNRTLWLSKWRAEEESDILILQIHETRGIVDALGYREVSGEKYQKLLQDVVNDEAIAEIESDYAVLLIRDALFLNVKTGTQLPAEYYVRRDILPANAIIPQAYTPEFKGFDLPKLARSRDMTEKSATLLEEEYFDGWFSTDIRLFDMAEEYNLLDKQQPAGRKLMKSLEDFIQRFIQDKVADNCDRLARRLFLIADLMLRTGRERSLVEKTLAVAANLMNPLYSREGDPFLRQFALESLKITREAVAEGFDFKLQRGWDDDEELWD